MNCVPLQFPPQWPDLCRRSLLVGFPFIGPQVGAYQHLCDQLRRRTPGCWALWGPGAKRIEAAQFVARILGEEVEWPNPIFIPDDPLELVFWDHKSCAIDDLSLVGALMTIETHFDASFSEGQMDTIWGGTMGDYVDLLLGRPRPTDPA